MEYHFLGTQIFYVAYDCSLKTRNLHQLQLLTVSVSHKQHGVVDHPGVAEYLPGVGNAFLVELQKVPQVINALHKGNDRVLGGVD